jgi:aspartate racemase
MDPVVVAELATGHPVPAEDPVTRHIVIIGGMGPQASLELHRRLIDRAASLGGQDGADYPRISHLSVPVRDLLSPAPGGSALRQIAAALRGIPLDEGTSVVIACNTAHILAGEIEELLGHPVESLIEAAVAQVRRSRASAVGLLASPATIRAGLYSAPLDQLGVRVLMPDPAAEAAVAEIVLAIIANAPAEAAATELRKIVGQLISAGAEQVIMGCTELSLVVPALGGAPVIDPLHLVAEKLLPWPAAG